METNSDPNMLKRYVLRTEHLKHEHLAHFKWHHNRTCTHCGSISPEYFFEAIEAGLELVPEAKSYKVIIHHHDAFYIPKDHYFFMFQHFSKEDKLKFIQLLNMDELKISDPGHFYILPFFVTDTLDA